MAVYIICTDDTEMAQYVKVGKSDDIESRISSIQKGMPILIKYGVQILAKPCLNAKQEEVKPVSGSSGSGSGSRFGGPSNNNVDDGIIERTIHRLFSASHRWGEWFDISYKDAVALFQPSENGFNEFDFKGWFTSSSYKESFDFSAKHKREIREAIDELSKYVYSVTDIQPTLDTIIKNRLRNSNYDNQAKDDLFD